MARPGIPREKFPWFPKIDYGRCKSDLQCLNYCPYDVFEWDADTGRPVVVQPENCLPGCDICVQLCRNGALSFPTKEELHAALEKLRAKASLGGPPSKGGWR